MKKVTDRGKVPAYEAELKKIYDEAVEIQRANIGEQIEEVVRAAYDQAVLNVLGMERQGWDHTLRLSYSGDARLRKEVAIAAEEVVRGLKWDDPKFSAAELERIRKAYRGAFITSCVEHAKEAAARHAYALVEEVTKE